jgi:LCP family protein required for cell wall assembly
MIESQPPGRDRSAVAAALFSALFPGLGQLYVRRIVRGLAWALLPAFAVGFLVAVVSAKASRDAALAQFSDPGWLAGALIVNAVLLVYRVLAVIDAYRVARNDAAARVGLPSGLRALSVAGLIAVVVGLSLTHVAIGRANLAVYQTITNLDSGDQSPISSAEPSFEGPIITPGPETTGTATTGPGPSGGPTASTETPTDPPLPTPSQGPPWDGTERLNILLIGADHRPGGGSYLTDTMIVASIDPGTHQVALFSLPRDMTNIPLPPDWPAAHRYANGVYPNKINTLYTIARNSHGLFPGSDAQRGYTALKGALSQLYGLEIKYYIALDFAGFMDAIEALGGVTVDVQVPVRDVHYPADDGRGSLNLYIPPGIHHFDGRQALAYARARHATSDFDRAQRQQRVITSIRNQTDLATLLAPGRIDALFKAVQKTVKTDIPPELFPKLVTLAQSIDLDQLRSIVFTPPRYGQSCYPCPPTGLYILLPHISTIRATVKDAFTVDPAIEKRRQRIESEAAVASVLRGTPTLGQADQIAGYLQSQGIDASVSTATGGVADRLDYQQTVIRAYNGAADQSPETARLLKEIFAVPIETVDDTAQTADSVIITGGLTPTLTPPP